MQPEKTPRERVEDLISLLVPDWRPTPQQVLWAIRIVIVLSLLIAIGYSFDITLWDWLNLLIVPAVLALGGYLFTRSENRRSQDVAERQWAADREIANKRTKEDRKIAHERAEIDRQIADQRRQDDALQAYIDQMGQLFIDKASQEEGERDKVRTFVRARTLTVLKTLDAEHNRSVLQFLIESELLGVSDFRGADLEGADLRGANLRGVDFSQSNLKAAKLSHATLIKANLSDADLRYADLNNAYLNDADLRLADLQDANLEYAKIEDADLRSAVLHRAKLGHASLRGADLEAAKLEDADLSHADLLPTTLRLNETPSNMPKDRWERSIPGSAYRELFGGDWKHPVLQTELGFAKLARANLSDADLRYVNLYDADLQDADLTRTNLQGATARARIVGVMINEPANDEERSLKRDFDLRNDVEHGSERVRPLWDLVPVERLRRARSLKDATLPDGSKYP